MATITRRLIGRERVRWTLWDGKQRMVGLGATGEERRQTARTQALRIDLRTRMAEVAAKAKRHRDAPVGAAQQCDRPHLVGEARRERRREHEIALKAHLAFGAQPPAADDFEGLGLEATVVDDDPAVGERERHACARHDGVVGAEDVLVTRASA